MEKRININQVEPQAYKAMYGLESYLTKADISKTLKNLIKIRASQINNCAYCIDMHTKEALKHGETNQPIFLVSAWKEAIKFFTEEEQTVLAMTEEITLIHQNGLSKDTYQKATRIFTENQIAQIIMVIVTINAWNRIAVSTHKEIE
ncbi:Carboxymuconolactone decarboxylase family protein [Mariniflexile rhizosphaerae]|uniref:carboxymuconolactone decarboxylase family protein n=1 Tax=unclassified Mariniflexile TaxID=2643887 RepID=UPI000CB73D0A|nr:carboxymuconolactone decarboxylase family protein [Mariniflexile sp. TRM1-10]AXP81795.1 Carboxymuconolactone decarboxylase family protein [Mariniflexile sp. TRM1-10]PLB20823.1 MAG: Alkylhydroperoxidase like protein, AhpD family [Flavobacteriaceae bacterium FS1-H7996/R]